MDVPHVAKRKASMRSLEVTATNNRPHARDLIQAQRNAVGITPQEGEAVLLERSLPRLAQGICTPVAKPRWRYHQCVGNKHMPIVQQHHRPGEVPTQLNYLDTRVQHVSFRLRHQNLVRRAHRLPFDVVGSQVHGAAKDASPLDVRTAEVWVANDNGPEPPKLLDAVHYIVIEKGNTVPEDIATRRLNERRELANAHCWLGNNVADA